MTSLVKHPRPPYTCPGCRQQTHILGLYLDVWKAKHDCRRLRLVPVTDPAEKSAPQTVTPPPGGTS